MLKISVQLSFVLVSAAACEGAPSPLQDSNVVASTTPSQATNSVSPTAGPPPASTPRSSALSCTPEIFGAGDTLTVRMRTPHGDYLTANQPDGTLFFIVYPQRGVPTRNTSLVPSDGFKTTSTLRLPATLRAQPWVYGRDTTEALFSQPGTYILWVGENLEGDFNPRSVSCRVKFVAR